jgi:DNA-binding NarL/FixJ family response regulator
MPPLRSDTVFLLLLVVILLAALAVTGMETAGPPALAALPLRPTVTPTATPTPDWWQVCKSSNTNEILPLVELHRPQVLLLDLRLPIRPGAVGTCFDIVSTLTHLRQHYSQMQVIVISQCDGGLHARSVLRTGVQGYLLKDDALTAHLVEAIRAVMAGNLFFSERIRALRNEDGGMLTERQIAILSCLATQLELPRCAVARQLGISINTRNDHLRNIYQTLGVHNLPAALRKAVQMGLLSAEDSSPSDEEG